MVRVNAPERWWIVWVAVFLSLCLGMLWVAAVIVERSFVP